MGMLSFFKTPQEREEEAARKALARLYEREVLLPAARGGALLEEADMAFRERHSRALQELFGEESKEALGKLYEREVLLPAARGEVGLGEAMEGFQRRHGAELVAAFGEDGPPAGTDPFEVG